MYNRHGQYVPDPAWRQTERPDGYDDEDWDESEDEPQDSEDEPQDDHDPRFMDKFDQDNGDSGDPPF